MATVELVIGLLSAVAALVLIADRIAVPYPVLLVIGGLVLGFIPGLPSVAINPDLIFLLVLPPLLQNEAFFTSLRDLRANLRLVGSLAVGLVLVTAAVVAVVVHAVIPGLSWAVAFVFGAIVSPPDPVAFSAISDRISLPQRLIVVLKDEGLINDATALTAYRVAVAAVVAGTFSLWSTGAQFVTTSVGGVLIGLAMGWLVQRFISHVDNTAISITIALAAAFATYLIADMVGVSGVLAVVTSGLYRGRREFVLSVNTRLQSHVFWEVLVFLINGAMFVLIGLQLSRVMTGLTTSSTLLWYAVIVSLTVIVTRFIWVFMVTYIPHMLRRGTSDDVPPWQQTTIIAWAGMRGIISLASALGLPLLAANGQAFPHRNLIIFLTFCVILSTLVLQGLSLPLLIRWLHVAGDDGMEREEAQAHLAAIHAAQTRLDELADKEWVPQDLVDQLHTFYDRLSARYATQTNGDHDDGVMARAEAATRLRREVLSSSRDALIQLRDEGAINDEVLRHVERALDLEERQLDLR